MKGQDSTDVVVIGGGPAGSTAATLIAQRGYRVQLFEREKFPRFHIGESLIPETYWVLKRLNMLPKMKQSHFVEKRSVQFINENGKLSEPFLFFQNKPHECSQTWQVRRSEFDEMMLNNAAEHGVQVHQGARVQDVLFEGDRAVGAQVTLEDGSQREVGAKVVVDASGQSSLIQNRFHLRVWDPKLKKAALWTYFTGARREGIDPGATLVISTKGRQGWFWFIPLHDDVTSIGIVTSLELLFQNRGDDHEKIFQEEANRCPGLQPLLAGAKKVAPFRTTKDYSYRSSRAAGNGWVLVGDAYGFLDPLYSSGVLLALKSGSLAADAVADGLVKRDTSEKQLGGWAANYNAGMDRMRRLVCEYYDGFNFGRFVRKYPHLKGHLTDLLVGDLFEDKVDDVIEPMNEIRREMELSALDAGGAPARIS